MKVIAVINQKGGVGKTTSTANVGAGLARLGKRVLLLDMDPQSNLTLHFDRRPDVDADTVTQLLLDDVPLANLVQETATPGLAIAPADTSLGGVDQALANRLGRETILREAFEAFDMEFDFVLIDCPPSLGVLSANALVAAQEVLIPMQTEYFSLQGMAKLTEVIDLVRRRLNPQLEILCVLPCMVDLRTKLTEEVLSEIHAHFGDLLARSYIRNNVKLAEAPSFGLTIFEHAPDSNGAYDYWDFAVEVLSRHGENVSAEYDSEQIAREVAAARGEGIEPEGSAAEQPAEESVEEPAGESADATPEPAEPVATAGEPPAGAGTVASIVPMTPEVHLPPPPPPAPIAPPPAPFPPDPAVSGGEDERRRVAESAPGEAAGGTGS